MWMIKKLTKQVRITDPYNNVMDITFSGIAGYYPVVDTREDAIEISENFEHPVLSVDHIGEKQIKENLNEFWTWYDNLSIEDLNKYDRKFVETFLNL
jgi:4-hydroxyphenylpyruvate dioxygenase-like putative hemolysin